LGAPSPGVDSLDFTRGLWETFPTGVNSLDFTGGTWEPKQPEVIPVDWEAICAGIHSIDFTGWFWEPIFLGAKSLAFTRELWE